MPIFDPMATTTIEMIAHCLFHQTPVSERARCEQCGSELAEAAGKVYCPHCLVERPSGACPICTRR